MSQIAKLLAFSVAVLFATVAIADNKQDQMKLQGKWKAEKGPAKNMVMKIDGNKFNLSDGKQEFSGTFTIDSSKSPSEMDLTIADGKGAEIDEFKGKTSKAIYELDGDTFKWCAGEPGKGERPTEFEAKGNLNLVFQRDKE